MTATNFNELWQSQQTAVARPEEIIAKAKKVQRNVRRKIILGNVLLGFTLAFVLFVVGCYQPTMMTTKIGTLLVVIAIAMQMVAAGGMISLAGSGDSFENSAAYLKQMLRIKKKQSFLQTTILSLYFILLSVGIFLYMYEYTLRMSLTGSISTYAITGLWFAFSWFYLRPRTIKKQQSQINNIIENLEQIDRQFSENNS